MVKPSYSIFSSKQMNPNSVHKPDNANLNEPFPLVSCINLINDNLNEPLPTSPCKKLITHFYKSVRINNKKDFPKNARGSNNRPNKPRQSHFCLRVYKHRHSQTFSKDDGLIRPLSSSIRPRFYPCTGLHLPHPLSARTRHYTPSCRWTAYTFIHVF